MSPNQPEQRGKDRLLAYNYQNKKEEIIMYNLQQREISPIRGNSPQKYY